MNGQGLTARISTGNIIVGADGTFTFTVVANDEIAPAGTYYAVTIRDDNGDIAQVNAYRFTSDNQNYNLNVIDPYDPNQPPPPLPPLIIPQLLVVPFSATPNFDGSAYTAWQITLTGNVTSSTLSGLVVGNLYTFILRQDSAGGHAFAFPPNCFNASAPVNTAVNGYTIQTFVADGGSLYAIGPGGLYTP
jgi:hypothetical protein